MFCWLADANWYHPRSIPRRYVSFFIHNNAFRYARCFVRDVNWSDNYVVLTKALCALIHYVRSVTGRYIHISTFYMDTQAHWNRLHELRSWYGDGPAIGHPVLGSIPRTGYAMNIFRNIEARLYNRCWSGKARSITYSECVCVCVCFCSISYQCACAILSSVPCPTLQYFPTLSHKRHNFRKKSYWTQNVCFDFLCSFCLKHFSL